MSEDSKNSHFLPEHAAENRSFWDGMADEWTAAGEQNWNRDSPVWGIWGLPEEQLRLLPENMSGIDAIELGCGTGYVGGWMARRGATVVGIDNSERQLATAKRLMAKHGTEITLIHGNAETVPYPDSFFDFAISEYGAAIWCDPELWVPEAYRLLKHGGKLTFMGTHPFVIVCTPENGDPCEARLHRSYFEIKKIDWRFVEIDPGGIEFNLPFADWLKLFRKIGFEVLNCMELQAPENAVENNFVPVEWARKWPSEQVWQLRKP